MISVPPVRPGLFAPLPAPAFNPYRACELCVHGRSADGGERRCAQEDARLLHGQLPPVHLVRARGGACGPDALRLDFPGLNR